MSDLCRRLAAAAFVFVGSLGLAAQTTVEVDGAVVVPVWPGGSEFSLGAATDASVRIVPALLNPISLGGSFGYQVLQTSGGRTVHAFLLRGLVGTPLLSLRIMTLTAELGLGGYLGVYRPVAELSGTDAMIVGGGIQSQIGAVARFPLPAGLSVSVGLGYNYLVGLAGDVQAGISVALDPARLAARPRVDVDQIEIEPVFPSLIHYYRDHAVGSLTFVNREKGPIEDLRLTARIERFDSTATTCLSEAVVDPDTPLDVPIRLLLPQETISVSAAETVRMVIGADYVFDDREKHWESTTEVTLYNRNAIVWDNDEKAAAFVTALDPGILEVARNAMSGVSSAHASGYPKQIAAGVSMLSLMSEAGIEYNPDPSSPFSVAGSGESIDFVQFPLETLQFRAGDCDDLTVLYCALLEAAGVPAAFVLVPGHILAAISLEMPARGSGVWVSDRTRIIEQQGTAWIPVEVTELHRGFAAAWEAGSRAWAASTASGTASLLPVRSAWQRFPAVSFSPEGARISEPAMKQATEQTFSELRAIIESELYRQEVPLLDAIASRDSTRLQNRLAVLYARFGRLAEARTVLERIVVQDPEYGPGLVNLGYLYFLAGQYDEAGALFSRASASDPGNPEIEIARARCAYELGRTEEAAERYRQAAAISDDLARRYSYLGAAPDTSTRASSAEAGIGWMDE